MFEKFMNKWLDKMWGHDVRLLRSITSHIPFVGKRFTAIIDAHWEQRKADTQAWARKLGIID